MDELLERGQALQLNPYITQIERLSNSFQHLTRMHGQILEEGQKNTMNHVKEIGQEVNRKLCVSCGNQGACKLFQETKLEEMIAGLFLDIDEYGAELSTVKKRELEHSCIKSQELRSWVEGNFWKQKQNHIWETRISQSKQSSFVMLRAFVEAMEESTREIDASIFQDEHMERKMIKHLKQMGVRPLKVLIFVSNQGRFEVHVSAKSKPGICISIGDIGEMISKVLGRRMVPEKREPLVMQQSYETIVFMERGSFQMLHHVSRMVKEGSEISGDNFLITDIAGGKKCVLLSDGMGSGVKAYRQSRMVLELAEELLESGIPPKQTMDMMNGMLVREGREVEYATLDMCVIDSYKGEVDLWKAGAASSYIVSPEAGQEFHASSLPMGVMMETELDHFLWEIRKESFVIMVTDGVVEHICKEERKEFIESVVRNNKTKNPREIGDKILEKALESQEGIAKDDMMVLVLGVWELQF